MPRKALVVIDAQYDYFPGGAWALPHAEKALPNILKLILIARQRGEPVVFIQHITPAGSPVFAEGSPGVRLHADLGANGEAVIFEKSHPSSFQDTGLQHFLESAGIESLDIRGFMTQMCCDTTTREAYQRGYSARLFKDACAARDLIVEEETIPDGLVHRVSLGALSRFAKIAAAEEAG